MPAFLKIFADQVLGEGDQDSSRRWPSGWLAAAVAQAGLTWLQQSVLIRLSTKLSLSMSTRFMRHMLRLPVGFFLQRFAGEPGGARRRSTTGSPVLLSGQLAPRC